MLVGGPEMQENDQIKVSENFFNEILEFIAK